MEIDNSRIAPPSTHSGAQSAPIENQPNVETKPGSNAAASMGNTADRVSLTGEAVMLKELEAQIANQPIVDSQRVAELRAAIDDGTFTIRPERIAEKMMSLEQALTDAR